MANELFGLSTDPASFGIDQPPDQGSQEASAMLSGLGSQAAADPFAALSAFAANAKAHADDQNVKLPFTGITMNPDGTLSFKNVNPDTLRDLVESQKLHRQILGGFAQQAEQIHAELQRAQSQPWQQLGTALAANMANQPGMPGWVRGLGQTAAQMNPTVDQLRAQYLGTMGKGAEIAEKGIGLGIAAQRNALDTKQAELTRKTVADEEKRTNDFVKTTRLSAKPGQPLPREAYEAQADLYKIPPEKRDALYAGHVAQAQAVVAQEQRVLANRANFAKTVSDLAEQRQIDVTKATAPIKMAIMREAFQLTHGDAALDFERRKKEVDNAANMALAQTKALGVLDSSSKGMLRAGLGTNLYVGSLGNMLQIPEIASAAEPAFLVDRNKDGTVKEVRFNPEAVLPQAWKSMPRTEAENMIAHEMPRILALLFKQGVGAQMFRSAKGVELLNSLGVSNKIRVDQMQTILENIRHTNNLSNFAPVVMTSKLPWQQDPDLAAMAGMNDPKNASFWSGTDQFGGKMPLRIPTGGAPPPATAGPRPRAVNPQTGKAVEWDGKSWVPAQ